MFTLSTWFHNGLRALFFVVRIDITLKRSVFEGLLYTDYSHYDTQSWQLALTHLIKALKEPFTQRRKKSVRFSKESVMSMQSKTYHWPLYFLS